MGNAVVDAIWNQCGLRKKKEIFMAYQQGDTVKLVRI